MKAAVRDLILVGALLALAAYVWHETSGYPRPSGEAMVEGLGPAFYPRILAIVLAGLACLVALAAVVRGPRRDMAVAAGHPETHPRRDPWRAGAVLAVLVAYWLLLPVAGFLLATFAALVAAMAFLAPPGRRGRPATWGIIAACSAAASGGVFLLFTRVVKVPIPTGILFGS